MPEELTRPPHLTPIISVGQADPELVELGRRYWDWLGSRTASDGTFLNNAWAYPTSKVAEAFGEPAGRLYIYAALGVEALLPDIECPTCAQPVSLKSRTSLDVIARDDDAAQACRRCDDRMQAELRRVGDPEYLAKRIARRQAASAHQTQLEEAAVQRRAAQALAAELSTARRAAVHQTHPLQLDGDVDWESLRASFRTEVGALAILDYAAATSPIPALRTWEPLLCPNGDLLHEVLVKTFQARLLRIHPDSNLDAFVWQDEAFADLSDNFYPSRVDWYAWQGPSVETAAEHLQEQLRERTSRWLATARGIDEVTALAQDLIAAETVRYLDDQLDVHNLPAVPDNHRARLGEAASRVATARSLGQCYSLAWRAARNAAAMAQRHPYAPSASATAHAVNSFEKMVTEVADPAVDVPTYQEDSRTPLAAITRTLFVRVLEMNVMAASIPSLRARLLADPSFPQPDSSMLPLQETPDTSSEDDWDVTSPEAAASALMDALERSGQREADSEGLASLLTGGAEPIVEVHDLDASAIDAIEDALARVSTARASLIARSPQTLVPALLTLAYLLPGTVNRSDASALSLGHLIGEEVAWALGLTRPATEPPF